MALRDGIDTDYDEGDQFEEETVRLMFMFKLDTLVIILFSSKLCVLIGRVPDQGGGDDHSGLEYGSLTICRLVPPVFSLMINRDIFENLVISNPLCIWTS